MKLLNLNANLFLVLLAVTIFGSSCSSDSLEDNAISVNVEGEIWDGTGFTFVKNDGADPASEANQDRITDNVWLTRGNNGGQIYNAKSENSANKEASPAGTAWAFGSIEEIDQLEFRPFRATVDKPRTAVGKDLILYLIEDNIYISIRFTSWDQNGGGFSYERSTFR